MKNKYDQYIEAIKELLENGEIVIRHIRVNDGEKVAEYDTLTSCPAEHQEGYRRTLETYREVFIRDVLYQPVYIAMEFADGRATL